ncbi:MAG: type II toxin-antitoxin system HicB family antitoxin [Nitrospirae bacterium]|nr:type II toxin-antitoxin system HicB family antitoxin [Nitrospirota bacterium]
MDDGNLFAEIKGFEGVWASCDNIETCRQELIEVLEEWLILKIRDNDDILIVNGMDLNVKEVAPV